MTSCWRLNTGSIGKMHLLAHSLTAVPFLACGSYAAALGAVAPDITWLYAEWCYRRSGVKEWHEWAEANVTNKLALPYRLAHSVLIVPPLCLLMGWQEFLWGWAIHVALDLPTHSGIMRQQPLFPFTWGWKWIIK